MNTLIIQGIDGVLRETKGMPAQPAELEIVPIREKASKSQYGTSVQNYDESADDGIEAILHKLDEWELNDKQGNGLHRR